tara:strand:- start:156 stop:1286 length:1131 start_codon:yes stop_codon:yes gene_type:complete
MSLNNTNESLLNLLMMDTPANAVLVNGTSANGPSANGPSANGKVIKKKHTIKKVRRQPVMEEAFVIPKFHEYQKLKQCNYKVKFLKEICRHYKQKVSGNKHELVVRMYNHLRLSSSIVKIQRVWKKHLLNLYNTLRGPGRFDRKLCVNETDFYTMEDIASVPYSQLYTYRDEAGQIYAFEITSLFNLFKKGTAHTTNPYNRMPFPSHVRDDLKRILKVCKVFGDDIDVSIEEPEVVPVTKQLELRAIGLFHDIDTLGNYTDSGWFNNLSRIMHIRFIRELADIWHYRAQLSYQVKRDICPPVGNPFGSLNMRALPVYPEDHIKRIALNIIESMIKQGVTESSRTLGANYVLCALTLVCPQAAESLPWLYQSVAPIE